MRLLSIRKVREWVAMKTGMKSKSCLLVDFSMLLFLLISCDSSDDHTYRGHGSNFRQVACLNGLADNEKTECGYLTVPMNRDDPHSADIENYVVIFRALDGSASSASTTGGASSEGPIFFLNGGPGASNHLAIEGFKSSEGPFRPLFGSDRDIVITAQRGTNDSPPSLYYQGLEADREKAYEMNFEEESVLRIEATMRNYDRFISEDVDLSGYNSLEIAADLKALRDALYPGQQINIWSASYGTRLAMTVMKRYPGMLRSVVLDGILPPEINPFIDEIPGILYAIDQFFDASRADYPELRNQYDEIIRRLDNEPVDDLVQTIDGVPYNVGITATKFFLFVKGQLQSVPYNPDVPREIIKIFNGDYTAIAEAWTGNVDYEFPVGDASNDSTCDAVFESVFAATDANFTTPEETEAVIDAHIEIESIKKYFRHQFIEGYPCSEGSWVVDLLPRSMQDPVISDIPTLMTVGTLDPNTPAIFSRPSKELLSNSYYFEVPGGHAVSSLACVQDMMVAFYADPYTRPTSNCETDYDWGLKKALRKMPRGRLFPWQ